jgi:lipid-binding SYLF domain-containing protein
MRSAKPKTNRFRIFSFILLVSMFLGLSSMAQAKGAAPTIEFHIYKAGFVIGVSGGEGTLHYRGKSYPVKITGVSLGLTIGVSKAELIGTVKNLKKLSDIEGTYSAAQAGVALAGGEKVTQLKNSKGVVLSVKGQQVGVEFSLDLNGMEIELQ